MDSPGVFGLTRFEFESDGRVCALEPACPGIHSASETESYETSEHIPICAPSSRSTIRESSSFDTTAVIPGRGADPASSVDVSCECVASDVIEEDLSSLRAISASL